MSDTITSKMQPVLTEGLRQRHAVTLAYLIMLVGVLYTGPSIPLFLYFHRSWWLVASHALDLAILLGLFVYLRLTHRVNVVMWAVCVIDVIAIVPLALDSGIARTGLLTVTGALLVIFLLKGRAGLKFWTVTAYAAFAVVLILNMFGLLQLPYTLPQYGYFLLMETLAILLLWLYGGEKEKLDQQLADRTRQLEIAKASVERKVQERTHELAESRAELDSTIQSLTTIGLMMVDRRYHIRTKNTALENILGYGRHWGLGDFAKDIRKGANLFEVCERVIESGKVVIINEIDFKARILRIGVNPVYTAEQVTGIVLSIQDITEQKILDRSKDEFFSIASHELRTPLTAIRGNMSMVTEYFPEAMKDEALASMINDTHAASIRLIEIVNDFLDSSKLEQGKMVFNLAPVELEPLVTAVTKDLTPILATHHNTVNVKDLGSLPKVMADDGRCRQIVYNLLSNATKYSENAAITVSGEVKGRNVILRVSDTGKGIPLKQQKLLFHKFQQAGESILTRDDTKGTGLGLYISKLLATNMHGDIILEYSEEGKGSTFLLSLPLARQK